VKTLGKERELKDVQSFGAVKFSWPFIDSYSIEEHTCIDGEDALRQNGWIHINELYLHSPLGKRSL